MLNNVVENENKKHRTGSYVCDTLVFNESIYTALYISGFGI